jgi:hypothetical protein
MSKQTQNTTFISRGRITGLVRDEAPAGIGQNRTTRAANRNSVQSAADEAIFYRARLILGDALPRPNR